MVHKTLLKQIGEKLDILKQMPSNPRARAWYESTEVGLKHLNNLLPSISHIRRIKKFQQSVMPKRYKKKIKIRIPVGSSEVYEV